MVSGRYVKNGEVTEIYLGNGITELSYVPIKAFDINREKVIEVEEEPKRNKRDWILWTGAAATFICGAALGGILQTMYYCIPLFIGSLSYISVLIYANKK